MTEAKHYIPEGWYMRAKGVTLVGEITDGIFFNFQDPDGNLLMAANVPAAPKGWKQRDIPGHWDLGDHCAASDRWQPSFRAVTENCRRMAKVWSIYVQPRTNDVGIEVAPTLDTLHKVPTLLADKTVVASIDAATLQ